MKPLSLLEERSVAANQATPRCGTQQLGYVCGMMGWSDPSIPVWPVRWLANAVVGVHGFFAGCWGFRFAMLGVCIGGPDALACWIPGRVMKKK
jgi:hypothetical protein